MSSILDNFKNNFISKAMVRYFSSSQYNYNMSFLNNREATLIDVTNAWKVYSEIPHLNIVINTKAQMLSNMKLTIVDNEGNEVDSNQDVLDFLEMPNPLQSFKEWISQLSIMEDLYGNGFIYPLVGSTLQEIPSALWNLPSGSMKINKTGKLFEQSKIEDIIESYELDLDDYNKLYLPSEIIHTNNNDSPDYYKGTSKLLPLQKNLSTIDAVLKTANVLYAERGGIWMFSHDGKGDMGSIPLGAKEKDEVIKQYTEDYGIQDGQKRFVITNASINAKPISFPIRDLLLTEELESDFSTIIAMYGMDRDLFPSTKGATMENKKEASKLTYQNTIIPIANDKAKMLTKLMKLDSKGLNMKASYDHMPLFQQDLKSKAEQTKAIADAINSLIQAGFTKEEAEEMLGFKK